MYQYKPIPSIISAKIPFPTKYMRELGKNELSAIFIILIECLLTTNNQRKIETFYLKDLLNNQNFGFRYQQFLKKTFNTKEQITFKTFLEHQKIQDPQNVQSGEFLKAHYYDKTNKQISIPSVIEYLYKTFNVYIAIAPSQHLGSGKTSIPKDCYAVLLQDLENQYSIIKEQQPAEQSGCYLCGSKSPYFLSDGAKHKYCLDCLQKKIGYGATSKTFYTCQTCYQNIFKVDVRALEQKQNQDTQQENLIATNSQVTQSQYQPRQAQKLCSNCQYVFPDKQYFQNNRCSHILCQKCLEKQVRLSTCIIDTCTKQVDFDSMSQFLKNNKSQIMQNEQRSDQNKVNQVSNQVSNYQSNQSLNQQSNQVSNLASNINQNRSNLMQSQIQQPIQEQYYNCTDCVRQYKMDMLFTNYCGHFYCNKCADRYYDNIHQIYCKAGRCGQQIEIKQLKQFFIDQKIEQSKKTYDNCTVCGLKLTLYQMFQNQCKHNICFDCINKAFNRQYDWLGKGRCPDQQCRLSINMEELEEFFVIKQQEKLQEIEIQETKKDAYAMQVEEPLDQNNDQLRINDQRKELYNQNPKIEQIVQQQKNQSQILIDNRSVIQNGSQIKQKEAANCSMCGEDFTEFNKPWKIDCRKSNHVIGICCYLRDFDKCLCCEKSSPYKTFTIKFQKASNQVMDSQMDNQIMQSSYIQNGYSQQIDDNRNIKLTQSQNVRAGSNVLRRPN